MSAVMESAKTPHTKLGVFVRMLAIYAAFVVVGTLVLWTVWKVGGYPLLALNAGRSGVVAAAIGTFYLVLLMMRMSTIQMSVHGYVMHFIREEVLTTSYAFFVGRWTLWAGLAASAALILSYAPIFR